MVERQKYFQFGFYTKFLSAALLFALIVPFDLPVALAYENIEVTDGTVTPKSGDPFQLNAGEFIRGNGTSVNLTFNSPGNSFINNGSIGFSDPDTSDPVGNMDMNTLTGFTNNGTAAFNGTLQVSSVINGNGTDQAELTGTIIGTNTSITNNTASIMNGLIEAEVNISDLKVKTIINHGNMEDYDEIIITDSLTNTETIDGINTLTASEMNNNSANATIQNITNLTASTSLINNGTITDINTLTATNGLTNTGTISNVKNLLANGEAPTIENSGMIENIDSITGSLSLESNGSIGRTDDISNTTEIEGSLTTAGGTINVRINGTQNDQYNVTGSGSINGGKILVRDTSGGTVEYKAGDQWTVLTTSGLKVTESLEVEVDPTDPPVNLPTLLKFNAFYDENHYYLNVERAKNYVSGAQTQSQGVFGQYLDQIGSNYIPDRDLEFVLEELDKLSPGEGISADARNAMSQMNGAVYGSMMTMGIQNHTIVNNQIANMLRPDQPGTFNNCACDTGCDCVRNPKMHFWGTYYGIDGYGKSDGNAFGGDYQVNGILVGGDRLISPHFRIGGFFAFGDTQYNVNGLSEQIDADSYKGGIYFVRSVESGYLLGNINFGRDDYSSTRNISFLTRQNRGETSGNQFGLRLEKGFNYSWRSLLFQPFGAFQYISLDTDAFQENGTGTTALNIDASEYNSYRSELGARLVWHREGGNGQKGNLFLQTSWLHEFGDTCGSITGSFNNDPQNYTGNYKYTVCGTDLGSDWYNIGFGANYTLNQITLFGGYDFMLNDSQNLHTGNAGLAWKF